MKKINIKKTIINILMIICIFTLIFSSYKIIKSFIDSKRNSKVIDKINNIVDITEEETSIQDEETTEEETSIYWKYLNTSFLNVDLKELKKENSDTVGWIKVNGTNINYPFVQTKDNSYYLTHSFDKTYNSAGWVFLDYRNNLSTDKNTILYAHGRLDKTMFGTMRNLFTDEWINGKSNQVIQMSTEYENTLWQVFSIYKIPNTSDYIETEFSNDEEYQIFLDRILKRSTHNFNTTITTSDRILTLSTCYDHNTKIVLHAKLIKTEKK